MTIRKLFEPNSVAVVGASRDPQKLGHRIVKNLKEAEFEGKIYPVNPEADEILGLKCYPSLKEAPKKTQLAVIALPSERVSSAVRECEENNVSNVIVMSGGFSEVGEEGEDLEEELLETAEDMNIRVLGPNSQGVNNTLNGLCATLPLVTKEGPLSIVTQSGTIGTAVESWIADDNIGVSKLAVLGNKADIDETDLIEYLADDDETGVIALYLDGVEKGRKFLEVAEEAAENKPVVVLKGGRTDRGAEAIKSHTHSIAGKYEIFKSACDQAGVVLTESIGEFYKVCKGLSSLKQPEGKETVIITSSGGSGILALDAADGLDVNLIDLPERAVERLDETLPSQCILNNPLDLSGSANAEMYDEAIKILARYKDIQNLVFVVGDPIPGIAEVIKKRFDRLTLVPVMLGGGEQEKKEREKLIEAGIPVFSDPAVAMRVLDAF